MGIGVHEKIKLYVSEWECKCYKNGIPDEVELGINDKVPNWKTICLALLKNDLELTSLGFNKKTSKYYSILKRIEIESRDYEGKQLKLKL